MAFTRWVLLLACLAWPNLAQAAARCDNGASVDVAARCTMFAHYEADPIGDPRIEAALENTIYSGEGLRNIAVVVAVGTYPNIPQADLPAALNDAKHLTRFLIDQKFEEVLVLEDAAATKENIRYVLETYLIKQAQLARGSLRVLFAYTGHGEEDRSLGPVLVLSEATNTTDIEHILPLSTLKGMLEPLANQTFQLIALINACDAGSLFTVGVTGGNLNNRKAPGAHLVTAGAEGELTFASAGAGEDRGSVFFDLITDGLRSGAADLSYGRPTVFSSNGAPVQYGVGTVTLGALDVYLSQAIEDVNQVRRGEDRQVYSLPKLYTLSPRGAKGAFFFLSGYVNNYVQPPSADEEEEADEEASEEDEEEEDTFGLDSEEEDEEEEGEEETAAEPFSPPPLILPDGPTSYVLGHPELSVFLDPREYPIAGMGVSSAIDSIAWLDLQGRFRFAYIEATTLSGDRRNRWFRRHWSRAQQAEMIPGAVHVFNFCRSSQQQFDDIRSIVPPDDYALPIAVRVESWTDPAQLRCRSQLTEVRERETLHALLNLIEGHYAKTPLVYSSQVSNLAPSEDFAGFSIWHDRPDTLARTPIGTIPWTLWRHGDLAVAPQGERVAKLAFYGNDYQFDEFVSGMNIAAEAASDVSYREPGYYERLVEECEQLKALTGCDY